MEESRANVFQQYWLMSRRRFGQVPSWICRNKSICNYKLFGGWPGTPKLGKLLQIATCDMFDQIIMATCFPW